MEDSSTQIGCCIFLPQRTSFSRLGYRALSYDGYDDDDNSPAVTVVVGKERRVFLVDPFVLEKDPFRILMGLMGREEGKNGKKRRRNRMGGFDGKEVIFLDVDSILFEHILWVVNNDESPSLLQLNLKEIIDFYSQDY